MSKPEQVTIDLQASKEMSRGDAERLIQALNALTACASGGRKFILIMQDDHPPRADGGELTTVISNLAPARCDAFIVGFAAEIISRHRNGAREHDAGNA